MRALITPSSDTYFIRLCEPFEDCAASHNCLTCRRCYGLVGIAAARSAKRKLGYYDYAEFYPKFRAVLDEVQSRD